MRIAILTSGIMPVPAVQGGAVENLIDFYLEYNDIHKLHDITVYSVAHPATGNHPALGSDVNHYKYVQTNSLTAKLCKRLLHLTNRNEYYHYTIEYFFAQAMKDIRRTGYDMIIMENRPGYTIRLKDMTTARLVLHLHNDLLNSSIRQADEIYNALDGIVCVSDYIAGRVKTISPNDKKTVTVHNGIDTAAFSRNNASSITREAIGLSEDDFVLIFSGRIVKEKGISELIDAMAKLKAYDRIKLLVIGSSFYGNADNENDFATQLRAKAEPIKDRIIFTGFIPYRDVPAYMHLADAAILPSVWAEPFGLTIVEAQAAGLPVITTDKGGIPEVTKSENAIVIIAGKDLPDKLAKAITCLYNNHKLRTDMGRHAAENSLRFTKEKYSEYFFKTIEDF